MTAAMTDSLNHVAVLDVLLRQGARTEDRTLEGMTALMYAAQQGSVEGVDRLMRYGADPSATDSNGRTALDYASTEAKRERLQQEQGGDTPEVLFSRMTHKRRAVLTVCGCSRCTESCLAPDVLKADRLKCSLPNRSLRASREGTLFREHQCFRNKWS